MAAVPVGARAPRITLPDEHGTPVSLGDLVGAPVVLVFYPFAFSGVCRGELGELRDSLDPLTAAGARVLTVSCDPMVALRAWGEQERFGFSLLSDFWPHGAAARAYGVFDDESGVARRATFVIDAAGLVAWSVVNPRGRARDIADLRAAVERL